MSRRSSARWLRLEPLEDRAVPAVVYADASLVAGSPIESLNATGVRVTADRDASGTLTPGDQVVFDVNNPWDVYRDFVIAHSPGGTPADLAPPDSVEALTFGAAVDPATGDRGSVFATIQAAIDFAAAGDTVLLAHGEYAEAVVVTKPLTVEGSTYAVPRFYPTFVYPGTQPPLVTVTINAPAGAVGVTAGASDVTLRHLRVTGGAGGVAAAGVAGLTLDNVTIDGSSGDGVAVTGVTGTTTLTRVTVSGSGGVGVRADGAPGSVLSLDRVDAHRNAVGGFVLDAFATYDLTDVFTRVNGPDGGSSRDAINSGGATGSTVNFRVSGVTVLLTDGTSMRYAQPPWAFAPGMPVVPNQVFALSGVAALNLFVSGTVHVAPPPLGGTAISANGSGAKLVVYPAGATGTAVTRNASLGGLSGTVTFTDRAPITYTNIGSFAAPDAIEGAVLAGRVYQDANGNGVQDAGERGLAGVTVTLTQTVRGWFGGDFPPSRVYPPPRDGSPPAITSSLDSPLFPPPPVAGGVLTTTTDADGNYAFLGVPEGTYTVAPEHPPGTSSTPDGRPGVRAEPSGFTTGLDFATTTDADVLATPRPVMVGGAADGSVRSVTTGGAASVVSPFGATGTATRTASADVDGDGVADLVAVTGPGTPLRVAVVSGADGSVLVAPFDPFGGAFTGGGYVAAGDLDGDGKAEFVVTPDEGGGPRVTVFTRNADGTTVVRADFLGIDDASFRGGARAAVGDVNGDGTPDVVVAAGFGGGPRTAIFTGQSVLAGAPARLVGDFFAFPGSDATNLRNGSFVAAGDIDGDGFADLVFGGGPGGAPRVFILSGALVAAGQVGAAQASPVANFFVASDAADRGGARVAVTNANGDGFADVTVGSGAGRPARVRLYFGKDFAGGGEPPATELDVLGGAVLADGVYVG